MVPKIPDEDLIEELQRLAQELDRTPTQIEMNEHGEYSSPTYQKRFGSWNEAVETAGLEPNPQGTAPISTEELFDELHRLADELGHTPSKREMEDQGEYSRSPYEDRFGSWSEAAEAAGLEPNPQGKPLIPAEDLLDELRRLADEVDKTPSVGDMRKHGRYSHLVYHDRFGSWSAAIEEIGLEPNEFDGHLPDEHTKSELIDTLQGLAMELERTPEYEDVAEHTDIDPELYLDRWDSWWVACSISGVSQSELAGVFDVDAEEEAA